MTREEIERYNGKYNYYFDRSTEPTPRPAAMTDNALLTEIDDLVQVLTMKETADYFDVLNQTEPGRRYNAVKAELARRLTNREAQVQPAKG